MAGLGASGGAGRALRSSVGVAAFLAMAAIVVVALMPLGQWPFRGGAMAEVTMATTGDRAALLADEDLRYRDVEVPMPVLRALLEATRGTSAGVPPREVAPFLPEGDAGSGTIRIIFDPQVQLRMEDDPERRRLLVRFYDLADRRSARLREALGGIPDRVRAYFLTLRP
jgi:hypothetical protein